MMMLARALAPVLLMGSMTALPAADSNAKELVRYQLETWKAVHVDSADDVKKLVSTFKKLRCEVTTHSHGNHTDVRYRCPKWQELSTKDHETAHKWETWLKKYGFKTTHEH